jgi:hypothetical protein
MFVLENTAAKTVKRSKHREGSTDEDTSTSAERLKAKKNFDDPGTSRSKSFLSFSDSKIVDNITSLGVSIGTDIERSIVSMKKVELNRLLQTPLRDLNHKDLYQSSDDYYSEVDSELGLDHKAIQHLMGDIADDAFGMEGAPWSDFKTTPRKSKTGPTKKNRRKKRKENNGHKLYNERDFLE